MQSIQIPEVLRDALEAVAGLVPGPALAAAARRLSDSYRRQLPAALAGRDDLAAYCVTRLPATYAAVRRIFSDLPTTPATLLDLGAGPGTVALAAADSWGRPETLTLVEQNPAWLEWAERLPLPPVRWIRADITRLPDLPAHDLVTACYSLGELAPKDRHKFVTEAWYLSGAALVLVEPGTPAGFAAISQARCHLIELGAAIVAPCPHAEPCPLAGPDWCHFAVRVDRSRAHRLAKGGQLGYEDEKYSYLVASRSHPGPAAGRILRHPVAKPGLIELAVCTPAGLAYTVIHKKQKDLWRSSRKASWGGCWPPIGI